MWGSSNNSSGNEQLLQSEENDPEQHEDEAVRVRRFSPHVMNIGGDEAFKPIPVLPALLFILLIEISLLATVFVIPAFHEALVYSTNAFSVIQYSYIVAWTLITFICWYLYTEFQHIFVMGYHGFFRNTKHLHAASFFLYTAGLMVMCMLGTVVRDYCLAGAISPCSRNIHLTPVNYQQIIVVIVTLLSVGFNVKLIQEVYHFNFDALPADIFLDDLGVRLNQSTVFVNIGQQSMTYTVLEVQASIISSLKERIDQLQKQVVLLSNALEEHLNQH